VIAQAHLLARLVADAAAQVAQPLLQRAVLRATRDIGDSLFAGRMVDARVRSASSAQGC
jgi:hypothetical protein